MTDEISRLEFLPNEIFMEIFQHFDARDIFRMFYNLNNRFKNLLQSLNDLLIVLRQVNSKKMHANIDPRCVRTLNSDRLIDINLKDYSNLRRLKLYRLTLEQLDRLDPVALPHLEDLCIYSESLHQFRLDLFDEFNHCFKIFSNGYPKLTSCSLVNVNVILMPMNPIQSPALCYLTVGPISFRSYQGILSACPNLTYLRFSFPSFGGKILPKRLHLNLQRMTIDLYSNSVSLGEFDIDDYFSCVPNLQQLCIKQEKRDDKISKYLTSNWFAKSIKQHLLSIKRFKFQLNILFIGEMRKTNGQDILDRLESSFDYAHEYQSRYQSKLVFKFSF